MVDALRVVERRCHRHWNLDKLFIIDVVHIELLTKNVDDALNLFDDAPTGL